MRIGNRLLKNVRMRVRRAFLPGLSSLPIVFATAARRRDCPFFAKSHSANGQHRFDRVLNFRIGQNANILLAERKRIFPF